MFGAVGCITAVTGRCLECLGLMAAGVRRVRRRFRTGDLVEAGTEDSLDALPAAKGKPTIRLRVAPTDGEQDAINFNHSVARVTWGGRAKAKHGRIGNVMGRLHRRPPAPLPLGQLHFPVAGAEVSHGGSGATAGPTAPAENRHADRVRGRNRMLKVRARMLQWKVKAMMPTYETETRTESEMVRAPPWGDLGSCGIKLCGTDSG
jgi:hypothetical protein